MLEAVSRLFKVFISLFISNLEKQNPEALIEAEKQSLREQIAKYSQGLSSHAALCERLMAQVRKLEAEESDLRVETAANLKSGNRELAGEVALRLQTVRRELHENRTQLQQAEKTCRELIRARDLAIRTVQTKIQTLKSTMNDAKAREAMAELNEMTLGLTRSTGSSGETLNRLKEMVEEDRNRAAGRASISSEMLEWSGVDAPESREKILAEQALAEFAAEEGMGPTGRSSSSTPEEKLLQAARSRDSNRDDLPESRPHEPFA